jgi:hypothetical protein
MNATLPQQTTPAPIQAAEPRPLMPISAVMTWLDLDEDDVLGLVEEGALPWAFDIASDSAQRRAIRVLAESVWDLTRKQTRSYGDEESEWKRVAGLIFPAKETIVVCELARALNCCRGLARMMVQAKQFCLVPGSICRPGPGGSPQIVTASAAEWLRKRRVI